MNRQEFVATAARKSGIKQKEVNDVLEAMLDTILDCVYDGDGLRLTGFGSLEVKRREPHKGRNPQTGEEVIIPAHRVCVFKPGKKIKEALK